MTAALCGSGLRNVAGFLRVQAESHRCSGGGTGRPQPGRRTDNPRAPPSRSAPLRPRRRSARHYMSRRAAGAEAPPPRRTPAAHGVAFSEARPGLGAAEISRAAASGSRSAPPLLRIAPPAPRAAGRAPFARAAFRRQAPAGRPSMAPVGRARRAVRRGPGGAGRLRVAAGTLRDGGTGMSGKEGDVSFPPFPSHPQDTEA